MLPHEKDDACVSYIQPFDNIFAPPCPKTEDQEAIGRKTIKAAKTTKVVRCPRKSQQQQTNKQPKNIHKQQQLQLTKNINYNFLRARTTRESAARWPPWEGTLGDLVF